MDDRLALRLGALRLARRRGRVREAAWAAARLRLEGMPLTAADLRFSRDVRVKFGRALRVARLRREAPPLSVAVPLVSRPRPSRIRRVMAAIAAAALLLVALLLYVRSQEPAGDPEGAQPVAAQAAVATPPPPLRGRTQPGAAAPVAIVVAVTPAPTDAPSAPPATAAPGTGTGTVGGGTGAGGSGGGTGSGNGRGTPSPTVAPTPSPSPAPLITPDPASVMHVRGRVVDAATRRGLPGVCVSVGIVSCQGAPLTDAQGFFAVDLTIGRVLNWGLTFITPGYTNQTVRIPSRPGTVTIPDIRMRVGP
jgi:hypothetical protein